MVGGRKDGREERGVVRKKYSWKGTTTGKENGEQALWEGERSERQSPRRSEWAIACQRDVGSRVSEGD